MSRRVPRPINEFSAAHTRQQTMARIQAIEGRTIVDDVAASAGQSSGRWNISSYRSSNSSLTTLDWAEVFAAIQEDTAFRDGDEIYFPAGTYTFTGAGLVVSRSMKITGGSSSILTATGQTKLLDIQASHVSIDGLTFKGLTANTYSSSSYGVYVKSPDTNTRYSFISITNCQFYDVSGIAVQMEFVNNVVVRDNYYKRYARAAHMFLSCEYAVVENNVIEDAMNGAGNPSANTYPIAFSRNNNISLAAQPRSKNCIARNNLVVNNPWWEGIDTHGGDTIIIENNILYNVSQPIAIVSSNNELNVDTYAPLNCIVRSNYMNSLRDDGGYVSGIVVDGAGSGTAGSFVELASCIVADNIVIGYGRENSTTNQGGIVFKYTDCVIVKGNIIDRPSPYGVYIGNDNYSYIVSDNLVRDVWSTSFSAPSAINAPTFYHEGYVHGNKLTRGVKAAAFVNVRGLTVANNTTPATHNSRLVLGWNDFDLATVPIQPPLNMNSPGGIIKLATFISPTFTERPTVPTTALSGASTMADTTAVLSAIRVALRDKYGLIV